MKPVESPSEIQQLFELLEAHLEQIRQGIIKEHSGNSDLNQRGSLLAALGNSRKLLERLRGQIQREQALLHCLLDPQLRVHLAHHPDPWLGEGIQREVTVLFADLQGFSELCDRLLLEEIIPLLNRYLQLAWEAIRGEGGVVDRFMGDAILGWFNAPFDLPDHTYRALRAAWRMQQGLALLHASLPPAQRRRYRIGVHVGEAVVGPIGTLDYWTYTVVGCVVNYARRLQEAAPPGQIIISRAVFERSRDRIEARALPVFPVRGGAQVVPVYRFLGFREEHA
ncbi:MAG: adenylate/guanylate cyclase domain-containing protein [Anaerolineae bacterium]|nr:adenylate/guanylate cyclase domain-containing protein [Thermoflexus sp.]MDW8065661.1 adenylate/guanylate cyclase domain-containing protein [Anaerolineae bacterium]